MVRIKKKSIIEIIQEPVILKIAVPKNNEKTPLAGEQLFTSIHGILNDSKISKNHFSLEIISSVQGISFCVVISKEYKDFIKGQIYAQYPSAEIIEESDYCSSFNQYRYFYSTEISFGKDYIFPIRTFPNFEVDPLSSITSAMSSKIDNSDLSSIQILIRPINNTWQSKSKRYVERVKNSRKSMISIFASSTDKSKVEKNFSSLEENEISQIENKVLKVGYIFSIRVISLSNTFDNPKINVSNMIASFKQFTSPHLNHFVEIKNSSKDKNILSKFQSRYMGSKVKSIINVEELASLYHLPNISVETPSIIYSKAKKSEPPLDLPVEGVNFIGKTNFRGMKKRFGIKREDRRRHMYILGKTGTGKSTMMKNMIIQDIQAGEGVGIFDPHGELAESILDYIPSNRVNDVVIIDPSDIDNPVSINLLDLKDKSLKDLVADNIVSVFKKHFDSWGPRLEYLLHNCILTLIQVDNTSILGIQRILIDKKYRESILKQIDDPILLRFWKEEYEGMEKNPRLTAEAIAPIQNKVGRFLSSSTIRNLVGQVTSTIDLEDIINSKKILIVNLSQGKIGEESASLLGGMLITKLQSAAMQRVRIVDETQREDFYLYVDEFQIFATNAFSKILSESRKYRLNLVLAHQYISQLEESIQNAIFGNIGTIISFVIGPRDADVLEKEFTPLFTNEDLISLDKHHFYIRLMIDGMISKPFSAISEDIQYEKTFNKEKVIKVSRERYSRKKEIVEDKINRWSNNS